MDISKIKDKNIVDRLNYNVKIYNETLEAINNGFYYSETKRKVYLNSVSNMVAGSFLTHNELPNVSTYGEIFKETLVKVQNEDCLISAQKLVNMGYRTALLNFASCNHPGGGVELGTFAQEETICRKTTLTRSIYSFDIAMSKKYNYILNLTGQYPLNNINYSIAYSPHVTVFREGSEYNFMETPFDVNIITCAAIKFNGKKSSYNLTAEGKMPNEAKLITMNKIRQILRIGIIKGNDCLVLGAFGCGAFHNPPEEMAQLFKIVLNEKEFLHKYKMIYFSIIEDENSNNCNYQIFNSILSKIKYEN